MKKNQIALLLSAGLMLSLTFSNSFPNDPDFGGNQYLLNGQVLDFDKLATIYSGKLSIVKIVDHSNQKVVVPFYAYIRREGKIVDSESYAHNHAMKEVEMSEVLKSSRVGDELVIDPVEKRSGGQRTVILKQKVFVPHFQWFNTGKKNKDNC